MSKIICDVCGTSYPETAIQCPICGCVRPGEVRIFDENGIAQEEKAAFVHTPVKGGRFSKANVKRRNEGKPVAFAAKPVKSEDKKVNVASVQSAESISAVEKPAQNKYVAPARPRKEKPQKEPRAKKVEVGYIIAAIIFAIAVILIVVFLLIKFYPSDNGMDDFEETTTLQTEDPTDGTTKPSNPTDPSDPEPTTPSNPTDPTDPEPTEPTEPDPTEPTDPPEPPPVTYTQYTVKEGDNLWDIAAKLLGDGGRYPEIVKLNNITGDNIYVGQVLRIPER